MLWPLQTVNSVGAVPLWDARAQRCPTPWRPGCMVSLWGLAGIQLVLPMSALQWLGPCSMQKASCQCWHGVGIGTKTKASLAFSVPLAGRGFMKPPVALNPNRRHPLMLAHARARTEETQLWREMRCIPVKCNVHHALRVGHEQVGR